MEPLFVQKCGLKSTKGSVVRVHCERPVVNSCFSVEQALSFFYRDTFSSSLGAFNFFHEFFKMNDSTIDDLYCTVLYLYISGAQLF